MFTTVAIATTDLTPATGYIVGLATAGALTDYRVYQCPAVIPSASIKHHRITNQLSVWGAPAAAVIADMQCIISKADAAGHPLVINNAAWAWDFLQSTAQRHNMTLNAPTAGIIDPQVLDQHISGSRFKRPLKKILPDLGWQGPIPTDPRGVASALVGVTNRLYSLEALAGADLAHASASLYQEQEAENLAYRKAQDLPYRPTLPYPVPGA